MCFFPHEFEGKVNLLQVRRRTQYCQSQPNPVFQQRRSQEDAPISLDGPKQTAVELIGVASRRHAAEDNHRKVRGWAGLKSAHLLQLGVKILCQKQLLLQSSSKRRQSCQLQGE